MGHKQTKRVPLHPHDYYVKKDYKAKAAKAAYNFVPFTRAVLASPLDAMKHDFRGYIQSQETYSGSLTLELSNVTPLFIGGGNDAEADTFFAPNGIPLIPGSTLRGMIRSLFKIITAGTMRRDEDFTDRHLYFRCIMASNKMPQSKELNAYYIQHMFSDKINPKTGSLKKKARPAFLYRLKKDSSYHLAPCRMDSVHESIYGRIPPDPGIHWELEEKKAYILTGNQKQKEYVRCLFKPDWEKSKPVSDRIIQEYRDDTRRRGVNLLDDKAGSEKHGPRWNEDAEDFAGRHDIDFIVPCFYTNNEDGEITSFGHGRSYRIPYKNSIGDRLPAALQAKDDVVDFADAVFGRKEDWAGRVSFEDACPTSDAKVGNKAWIKPLLGANPTSYQLYLTQKDWPPAHWDSDAPVELRGYKMYWHKKIDNRGWQAGAGQQNSNIMKQIQPLLPGNTFSSTIHFRNLTAVELGALLKVFHLQQDKEDIVYKLGMGKSLGMGSVRIQSALHLDSERYGKLFDGGKWQESQQAADPAPFLDAFAAYVKAHLGPAEASYQASLKNLRIMLDWRNTERPNWNKEVSAVGSEQGSVKNGVDPQFTERYVLPAPDKVVK